MSQKAITQSLAVIQAQGEIQNIPPPQLDLILAKARKTMEEKQPSPPSPPTPPTP